LSFSYSLRTVAACKSQALVEMAYTSEIENRPLFRIDRDRNPIIDQFQRRCIIKQLEIILILLYFYTPLTYRFSPGRGDVYVRFIQDEFPDHKRLVYRAWR
jgi:hypothetical protein